MTTPTIPTIAIIPARCGSVRFREKNIYPLLGKPLLSYPVEAALSSPLIDRVIVSTDCEEIASVAREYGAEVPFLRPENISQSESPVVEAMVHCVEWLEGNEGYRAEYVFLLQPTTPLIEPSQFVQAMDIILKEQPDSIVAVTRLDTPSHPYNIRVVQEDGKTHFWKGEEHYQKNTLCTENFVKAANMWVTSRQTLVEGRRLEGKRNFSLTVDWQYALDIDYLEDLQMIEAWLWYCRDKDIQV